MENTETKIHNLNAVQIGYIFEQLQTASPEHPHYELIRKMANEFIAAQQTQRDIEFPPNPPTDSCWVD